MTGSSRFAYPPRVSGRNARLLPIFCPGITRSRESDRKVKKTGGALPDARGIASLLGPFSCRERPPSEKQAYGVKGVNLHI
jgi:hypothetical protein